MKTARQRRSFFEFDAGVDAFNKAFTLALSQYHRRFVSTFIPPENTHRFYHGNSWQNPANTEASAGDMKVISAELKTPLDEIIGNDLNLLERSFSEIGESMQRQFADMMYSTLSEACDASGNVVDSDASGNVVDSKVEGSLPNSFLAMLQKIEFAADKHGNVHMPQIHAAPEMVDRMIAALEAAPPEFRERIEQLKQQKASEATDREAARKAKFARYGE
jgi:hypothetical protein